MQSTHRPASIDSFRGFAVPAMVLATFLFLRRAILLFAIALVTFVAASCDCGWRVSSQVWLDENGNGQQDPAERPLDNIWLRAVSASGKTDPRAWITYTQQALGLPSAVVEDIAVQPDGSAWFLTRHGVLHFDPVLGESDVITNPNGWFLVPIVNQTADGTV